MVVIVCEAYAALASTGILFMLLFFKQKTAYEMRISDWSSDVCSSDLHGFFGTHIHECAHASGAAHRLDRDFSARWTKDALAMEEATAELTARSEARRGGEECVSTGRSLSSPYQCKKTIAERPPITRQRSMAPVTRHTCRQRIIH